MNNAMQHECKAKRTTLFNFRRELIIIFYTKFPIKRINVEKILKLWENCCFSFSDIHILKSNNFMVWQHYPLKRNLVPRFIRLARDKDLGGWHPTHIKYLLKHTSGFLVTHTKHFTDTRSNSTFNYQFFPSFVGPSVE